MEPIDGMLYLCLKPLINEKKKKEVQSSKDIQKNQEMDEFKKRKAVQDARADRSRRGRFHDKTKFRQMPLEKAAALTNKVAIKVL